jgi:hypothetical protein
VPADFTLDGDAEPPLRLRRLLVPVLALAIGTLLGFAARSWVAIPSPVVVDGHPTTLHIYRVDPVGALSQPGHGEAVIFKQATIARLVTELNRLPASAARGRACDKGAVFVTLSFSYDNGDTETVNVHPAPCGLVTIHGDETVVADALGSNLYQDVIDLLPQG